MPDDLHMATYLYILLTPLSLRFLENKRPDYGVLLPKPVFTPRPLANHWLRRDCQDKDRSITGTLYLLLRILSVSPRHHPVQCPSPWVAAMVIICWLRSGYDIWSGIGRFGRTTVRMEVASCRRHGQFSIVASQTAITYVLYMAQVRLCSISCV